MGEVRRATATEADVAELVRLRGVMLGSRTGTEPADDGWRHTAAQVLRARLAEPEPTLVAFVVERPGRAGALAACAVGTVERRLGGPGNPTGEIGHVFNVVTDVDQRRRGYSRLCMAALLAWYRDRGITKIDLHASPEGEPLYQSMGFVRTPDPAMRLRLPTGRADGPDPGR